MSRAPQPQPRMETYTRVGVIGDIHTRLDRLEWALRVLKQQEVECILATGDIVDGPQPEAVTRICELLQEQSVICVLGNHDRWLLDRQHRDLTEATFPKSSVAQRGRTCRACRTAKSWRPARAGCC